MLAGANPYRFSTKYFDAESELYYYGYRFYLPELARWLNRDPTEEQGGLNLYGFVGNNPLLYFDALGLRGSGIGYDWYSEDFQQPKIIGDGNSCCKGVTFDPESKCCENDQLVDKVKIVVINRSGGERTDLTGGHIDLVLPGMGLVGFFGDQSDPDDGSGRGVGWNIPGNLNVGQEWLSGKTPRPGYTLPPGMAITLGTDANGNPIQTANPLSTICELNVCPSDSQDMQKRAQSINVSPGRFKIAGRNCSSMGSSILQAGGAMDGGISGIDNPQNLVDQLKKKYGAKCSTGYVYWNWTQDSSGQWIANPSDIRRK